MKKLAIILLALLLTLSLTACGDDSEDVYIDDSVKTEDQTSEVEDYFEDDSLYFGRGEEIAPTDGSLVLVEYAEPIDCTLKNLAAWYKQDVKDKGYNYALVIYDGGDNRGVYASPEGVIHTDVVIEEDSFVDTTEKSEVYIYKNGKLVK